MTQPELNHLIIVCCHAIYLGGPTKGLDEDEWYVLHRDISLLSTFFQTPIHKISYALPIREEHNPEPRPNHELR